MEVNDLDKIIIDIVTYLKEYEQIYVIDENESEMHELTKVFCQIVSSGELDKKILIMATSSDIVCKNITYRRITHEEYKCLRSVYDMYEFSNRVMILSLEMNCGGLFNYVNNKILTREEVVKAILH